MEIKELAKLCMWCYKSGYDSAIEVLKGTQHIHDEEKMMEKFVNIAQQHLSAEDKSSTLPDGNVR